MKLQFRQQVARGDADECSRAKRQCVRQDVRAVLRNAKPKHRRADGNHQRKQRVHRMCKGRRPPGRAHQRGHGQSVERLVQEDHDKGREACERGNLVVRRSREHRRRQRNAFKNAVQGETDCRANPAEFADLFRMSTAMRRCRRWLRRFLRAFVMPAATIVATVVVTSVFRRFVLMKLEEPLEEEHHHESNHHRQHHAIDRCVKRAVRRCAAAFARLQRQDDRVRQQVQHANAEHGSADETQRDLQLAVAQPERSSKRSARERCDSDGNGIDPKLPGWRKPGESCGRSLLPEDGNNRHGARRIADEAA